MFQITIDDVFAFRHIVAVSGKCINRNKFSTKLVDDDGTEYTAAIPFIKHVVMPPPDYMTIELINVKNPDILKGRILRGIENE